MHHIGTNFLLQLWWYRKHRRNSFLIYSWRFGWAYCFRNFSKHEDRCGRSSSLSGNSNWKNKTLLHRNEPRLIHKFLYQICLAQEFSSR